VCKGRTKPKGFWLEREGELIKKEKGKKEEGTTLIGVK